MRCPGRLACSLARPTPTHRCHRIPSRTLSQARQQLEAETAARLDLWHSTVESTANAVAEPSASVGGRGRSGSWDMIEDLDQLVDGRSKKTD